ncbi:DUF2459 domain-containing protein [Geobacter sp. SVR]|uniref:DUF2459 domain-containing protein n=1 Tax=Geobacter sp. SVR TaxID=2495594 RepID=UPI00143EF845|nr:DUF2459 domain-containing protein [Geobacter sp. SVR]BCS52521.1 hypothetical protein GSVR_08290 [Geobacter sp. SVR]GCF84042.1 membrane protein [Geobacter sp. SVR]
MNLLQHDIRSRIVWTLLSLLLLLAVVVLIVPRCGRLQEWRYLPADKAEERSLHIVNHGWHTGIILSRRDLAGRFGFLDTYLGQTPYYEFGWGEAEFYQAERNTVIAALRALFRSNEAVIHVVALPIGPVSYFSREPVVELRVSETGLEHLREALHASFRFDERGRPYPLGRGLYGDSRFFGAEGRYSLGNTCNRWTATLLSDAGVPMDTLFTMSAGDVIGQAENARQRYACCAGRL